VLDGGKGLEYWDIFFTTYSGFTTADDVFQTLVRLFEDAESSPAEHRTFLRIKYAPLLENLAVLTNCMTSIITAMKYWATNPYLTVDTTVLARIQEFSMSVGSSPRMTELATELHLVVTKRVWMVLASLDLSHCLTSPRCSSGPYLIPHHNRITQHRNHLIHETSLLL